MKSTSAFCLPVVKSNNTIAFHQRNLLFTRMVLFLFFVITFVYVHGQTFVHPGGLHTQTDLDRMKAKVAEGAHPWVDGWNRLIADPQAQNTYTAAPRANMGSSRQRADADAHAAYLNAMRWYISGDTTYAACAVRICNAWSATVNQVPTGTDIPGLSGIPIFDFAMAAEVLRIYPGWAASDFERFKNMMLTYWYPVCHDFLVNHNGSCISHYWSNWDICNIGAILTIGVLCDDATKYNEAVDYFKNGAGMGSITNAVPYVHPGNLGQWQESGRDQEHAQLAVGMMASFCQVAWNQRLDLYGYDNNRLLAGAEYVARTNLSQPVPYQLYNNCDNVNQKWVSVNGIGRLDDRPLWELVYNHYVVRKGLSAPNVQAMAQVTRPEHGSVDHFGYGTLTFTLDVSASPYPPSPVPSAPTGVSATAGVSRVTLKWTVPNESTVQGYQIQRATTVGGPYTTIASWADNTYPQYTDFSVTNGTAYYYVIAAVNQSGTSGNSVQVSATPAATSSTLAPGWTRKDIGSVGLAGSASYSSVSNNSFMISGSGAGIGGTADAFGYTYGIISGDATITARLTDMGGAFGKVGIMIRESLDPAAKAFIMKRGDVGWRQAGFGARTSAGGSMTWAGGNDYTWLPAWFRLQRTGNTITAFESSDGITWFTVGSAAVEMNGTYYIGLAAGSGNTSALGTATFDNVTIDGGGSSAPPAPANLTATAGNTLILLSWDDSQDAATYSVKRAEASGGPYTTVATGITSANYNDSNLTNGTTYYYAVSAINFGGESLNSPKASAAPVLSLPPVPAAFTATAVSGSKINLSWTKSLSATSYNVKRATINGGPYTVIATTDTTSYSDTTIAASTTYYYVVSALNELGETSNSAQVSATGGQLSYWKFDESSGATATDSWGSSNGILASGAAWTAGAKNNAVRLDGTSNGYVTLPAGFVSALNDFSISAWIKLDATANWARVFDFGSGTGVYMFLTPRNGGNGTLRYEIKNSSGTYLISSNAVIAAGEWYHLALTQSGTTGILYVNGVEVGRNTNIPLKPSSLGSTTQNWIGKSQWPDPLLAGIVDDFRIYSRALSASEVAGVAADVTFPPAAPANLVTVAGNNQTSLSWVASSGVTGYNVKRALLKDGPYTLIANVTATGYVDTTATNCMTYFYIVTAVNNAGEGAATAPESPSLGKKLAGTLIGTNGSWGNNSATTKAAAVDGNLTTFFDGPTGTAWVGYDLGTDSASIIKRVRYAPRSAYQSRMIGGVFHGANTSDFSDAVTLFTVTTAPTAGVLTEQTISNSTPYRYVRYLSSATGFGNVAEVEFWGLIARIPVFSGDSVAHGTYDSAFHYITTASNMPTQFTATGLPGGLSIDTCTGIISGTPVVAGNFPVIITANNYYGSAADTVKLVIKRNQTISFNSLPAKLIGDADFAPGATASSGLPVIYSSSDTAVATIVDGKIHIKAVGTSVITALQEGDSIYNAAQSVAKTLTILPLQLRVQYKNGDTQVTNNTIKPYLKIMNADSIAIAYKELTVRYWFTAENYAGINTWIDYAQVGNSKVKMKYVELTQPHNGALGYIEYSFDTTAGNLTAGSNSGAIQSRFANKDWAVFNEADDYAYSNNTSYADNDHITLYRNGYLIWGTEPAAVALVTNLTLFYQNQNTASNTSTIRTYLKISNEGNVPVSYKDISIRYWFTKEGTSSLNYLVDYAKLGKAKITGSFLQLNPAPDSADTYFEIKIDSSAGTFYPLSNTGNIQYRITKADWSVFDETNDYSYKPAAPFAANDHITVYYKGALVYGTEPAIISSNVQQLQTGKGIATRNGTAIYPNPVTGNSFYISAGNEFINTDVLVKVYSVSGELLYRKQFKENKNSVLEIIMNKRLSPGMYLVQLNNGKALKLIVEKN